MIGDECGFIENSNDAYVLGKGSGGVVTFNPNQKLDGQIADLKD